MPKIKMTTNPNELSKTLQNLNILDNDSIANDSKSNQNKSNESILNDTPKITKDNKANNVNSNKSISNDSNTYHTPKNDIVANDSKYNQDISNEIKSKDIFLRPSKELRQRFDNYQKSVQSGGMKLIQNTYICQLLDNDLSQKGF